MSSTHMGLWYMTSDTEIAIIFCAPLKHSLSSHYIFSFVVHSGHMEYILKAWEVGI